MTQTKNPMTQIWVMTHRLGTTDLGRQCFVAIEINLAMIAAMYSVI